MAEMDTLTNCERTRVDWSIYPDALLRTMAEEGQAGAQEELDRRATR